MDYQIIIGGAVISIGSAHLGWLLARAVSGKIGDRWLAPMATAGVVIALGVTLVAQGRTDQSYPWLYVPLLLAFLLLMLWQGYTARANRLSSPA